MAVRVKICGIRSFEEASQAVEAGAHSLGFNFIRSSKRYIDPEIAREIILKLPPFVSIVGVFADEPRYSVEEIASLCKLHVLQFHGNETPEYCRKWSYPLVKALRLGTTQIKAEEKNNRECISSAAELSQVVEQFPVQAVLLDTYSKEALGGTGNSFDWSLAGIQLSKPVILAGGLKTDNIQQAIATVKPFAVDVASGVELDGRKNLKLMKDFIRQVELCTDI